MSLQLLYAWFLAYPGQLVNALALFFACAGSWLLLATRLREQQTLRGLALDAEVRDIPPETLSDAPTLRLNRFFKAFGAGCLVVALGLSWASTGL